MNCDFGNEQDRLRREIREFLVNELPGDWVGIWHQEWAPEMSKSTTKRMAEKGWLTYGWPAEYGGCDGTAWDQAVIQEELFARHEPRGGQYMGVNWIGPAIMKFGTDAQKATYLPEIARGEAQWAQLFSEPDAGSDLASLRTRASYDSATDEFVVNGEKIWTSYADLAQRGFLLARSAQDTVKQRGITAFLIDMNLPGIEVREVPSSIGRHRFHSVVFTDVRIAGDTVLGTVGEGWSVAMSALPYERIGNARYARTTRCLGFLEQHEAAMTATVRERLARLFAFGRMAELLNYRVVAMKDSEQMPTWEASAAFAANALYETQAAELLEDALGIDAYVSVPDGHALHGGEVEAFVATQAPTVKIQAGTFQVQMSIIAQHALGLPRAR